MKLEIIVIIILLFIFISCVSNKEHAGNVIPTNRAQEAIDNLASMFNSQKITVNNLEVLQNSTIKGDAEITGGAKIGKPVVINSDLTSNTLKTDSITPSGDMLIIGGDDKTILLKQKFYVAEGINTGKGDIWSWNFGGNEKLAQQNCQTEPRCDRYATDGKTIWFKHSNDMNWLIGSTNWPKEIFFSGKFEVYGDGGNIAKIGPAKSFEDCYDKAKEKNKKHFNYTGVDGWTQRADNCQATDGNTNLKTVFFKKY
jgi:hypothetical protein